MHTQYLSQRYKESDPYIDNTLPVIPFPSAYLLATFHSNNKQRFLGFKNW